MQMKKCTKKRLTKKLIGNREKVCAFADNPIYKSGVLGLTDEGNFDKISKR